MYFANIEETSPLIIAILASIGVLGLVAKEILNMISRRGDSFESSERRRTELEFMASMIKFSNNMDRIHSVNPKTGKVDAMTADIDMEILLNGFNRIEKAIMTQTEATVRLTENMSSLASNLNQRPCQVPEVLRELLPIIKEKTNK